MKFEASLDITAKIITIGIGLLFAFLIAMPFLTEANDPVQIYIPCGLAAIYLITYLYSPQSYTLTESELVINRPLKNLRIDLSDIQQIALFEKGMMNGAIRTFGVGGLFGYFGKFHNFGIGNVNWYLTRTDKAVILKTERRRIAVSPNDTGGFIAALKGKMTN